MNEGDHGIDRDRWRVRPPGLNHPSVNEGDHSGDIDDNRFLDDESQSPFSE